MIDYPFLALTIPSAVSRWSRIRHYDSDDADALASFYYLSGVVETDGVNAVAVAAAAAVVVRATHIRSFLLVCPIPTYDADAGAVGRERCHLGWDSDQRLGSSDGNLNLTKA